MKRLIAALTLATSSQLALADFGTPFPACTKPFKPFQFNNQTDVDIYNQQLRDYRNCINQFVREQREQANNHLQAAKSAIEAYNAFLQSGQ